MQLKKCKDNIFSIRNEIFLGIGIWELGFGSWDSLSPVPISLFPVPRSHYLIRFFTFLTTIVNIFIILEQSFNKESANSTVT